MLQLAEPIPEINIAVLGGEGVGKSTLVQRALDLPGLPPSQATQRKITAEGQEYLLRLLEVTHDDVDVDDEDDPLTWPETIDSKIMPKVDGVLLLYSIKDKSSLEEIPDMLSECRRFTHERRSNNGARQCLRIAGSRLIFLISQMQLAKPASHSSSSPANATPRSRNVKSTRRKSKRPPSAPSNTFALSRLSQACRKRTNGACP